MHSFPTYRQGRQTYQPGAKDEQRGFCTNVCSLLGIYLLLLLPPIFLVGSEFRRYRTYVALKQAISSNYQSLNVDSDLPHQEKEQNFFVHGVSSSIQSSIQDPDMGFTIRGALIVRRNTEYCQWQQFASESCETCQRTLTAKDGTKRSESYPCNCVTSYSYIKSWRPYRISSLAFDQPAAHHNPMRDPIPSKEFLSDNVIASFDVRSDGPKIQEKDTSRRRQYHISSQLMGNQFGILGSKYRPIHWVRRGVPPFRTAAKQGFFAWFFSWFPTDTSHERIRYESLSALHPSFSHSMSDPTNQDQFIYVGDGYFFSPYHVSTYEFLLKSFFQYMEGSLLDWQLGDLFPSCTAGDIRVSYTTIDPTVVSVLGQLTIDHPSSTIQEKHDTVLGTIHSKVMDNGEEIGLIQVGEHSAHDMILAADSVSRRKSILVRVFFFVWCFPMSRILSLCFYERDVSQSNVLIQVLSSLALWCVSLGTVWTALWSSVTSETSQTILGFTTVSQSLVDGIFFILFSLFLLLLIRTIQLPPKANVSARGMIRRWAGVPPSWRREKSYPQHDTSSGVGRKLS